MKEKDIMNDWVEIKITAPKAGKLVEVKGTATRRGRYNAEFAAFHDCDTYPAVMSVTHWRYIDDGINSRAS